MSWPHADEPTVIMGSGSLSPRNLIRGKASGTIELMPHIDDHDGQVIAARSSRMLLYGAMLADTWIPCDLVMFGDPDGADAKDTSDAVEGGCFLSLGLFISSRRRSIVAAMATFAGSDAVGDQLDSRSSDRPRKPWQYCRSPSISMISDGISTPARDLLPELMALGMFLTAKSVDSERWRAKTDEDFCIIGGVAVLVFGAVAAASRRQFQLCRPGVDHTDYAAYAGLGRARYMTASGATRQVTRARAKYGTMSIVSVLCSPASVATTIFGTRKNKR